MFVMEIDKNVTPNGISQVRGSKKNSTTEIPLVGLAEVADFVTTIHEKALELASMPEVAKGVGYESATSTPFYRRLVAGRLFGLIGSNGAAITKRATDYIRPDQEDAKAKSLQDAICGIPYYTGLIEKYRGRKLNTDLVKNAISKDFNLMDSAASAAAKAFAASLKFAGMLAVDETVGVSIVPPKQVETPNAKIEEAIAKGEVPKEFSINVERSTFLDKERSREVTFDCPFSITRLEFQRIMKWIEATWIVEEETKDE